MIKAALTYEEDRAVRALEKKIDEEHEAGREWRGEFNSVIDLTMTARRALIAMYQENGNQVTVIEGNGGPVGAIIFRAVPRLTKR